MPTKRLYMQPIPEGAQLEDRDSLRSNLTQQGILGGGAAADQLSQPPGDHVLRGQYRCRSATFAELMAEELRELGNSDGFDAIPFYRTDETGDTGYYIVERVTEIGPVEPQERAIQQFQLSLSKAGTRRTQWQAVATHPTEPSPGHDFGTTEEARVGIPAAATKIRAVDEAIGPSQRVSPTPAFTVPAEYGDVEVYDATALAFDDPIFLYDTDYDTVGRSDPVVWDTLGNASKFDTSGSTPVRQWEHVFDPAHDPIGVIILDNGLLRVECDEANGTIAAEVWDAGGHGVAPHGTSPHGSLDDDDNAAWTEVTLSHGDWELVDVDLTHISPVRAEAQLEFEDTSDGSLYAVDINLDRGLGRLQVWTPESVTASIPSGLADLFEPIASDAVYDPGVRQTLISREEVRR